jgi:hypothetical protein
MRSNRSHHDGTTQIATSAPEFMQRSAVLMPRPQLHPIRFHGVLAPHARLRAAVVPGRTEKSSQRGWEGCITNIRWQQRWPERDGLSKPTPATRGAVIADYNRRTVTTVRACAHLQGEYAI